jgi:hypothetical protein
MDFAPITYEIWEAFADERRHWEIIVIEPGYVATDRKRFLSGDELMDPMTASYTSEICGTRELAAYYIGCRAMQAALERTGIIHE